MVRRIDVPAHTLIADFAAEIGGFADCFITQVPRNIPLATYVEAFYTTPLFLMERALLRLAGHPSTDADARAVATGTSDLFAIWHNPIRRDGELVMQQTSGATASWFMVRPTEDGTELYFGSVVRPSNRETKKMPLAFHLLSGVHTLYSYALLASAARRVVATSNDHPKPSL